jgi:hypothetical protein
MDAFFLEQWIVLRMSLYRQGNGANSRWYLTTTGRLRVITWRLCCHYVHQQEFFDGYGTSDRSGEDSLMAVKRHCMKDEVVCCATNVVYVGIQKVCDNLRQLVLYLQTSELIWEDKFERTKREQLVTVITCSYVLFLNPWHERRIPGVVR